MVLLQASAGSRPNRDGLFLSLKVLNLFSPAKNDLCHGLHQKLSSYKGHLIKEAHSHSRQTISSLTIQELAPCSAADISHVSSVSLAAAPLDSHGPAKGKETQRLVSE